MKTTVTSKGQVTIPQSIRIQANITPGSLLDFFIEKDGSLTVRVITREIIDLKGIVKAKRKKPVSLKEMKKGKSTFQTV